MVTTLKNILFDMFRFPRLSIGAYKVWRRNFFYFKKYLVTSLMFNLSEPILYILAFGYGLGFFVGEIEGVPYMRFLAPAILASTTMMTAVFECTYSSFTKLRVQKTYETIMMTPVSIDDVVVGEIIWGASKAFFSSSCVLFVFLVFGVEMSPQIWMALPILIVLGYAISAMSMVVTSYARDYDSFSFYFTLVVTPMSLLSGTYFPLSRFPEWAQTFSWFLPLTHGVSATRAVFLGQYTHLVWAQLAMLLVMSVLFTNWAVNQIRRRLVY